MNNNQHHVLARTKLSVATVAAVIAMEVGVAVTVAAVVAVAVAAAATVVAVVVVV